jgi:hypothetical protein
MEFEKVLLNMEFKKVLQWITMVIGRGIARSSWSPTTRASLLWQHVAFCAVAVDTSSSSCSEKQHEYTFC